MDIASVCKSYFSGFDELLSPKSDLSTKIVAALKILSYFTVLLPAAFGLASLFGRVSATPPSGSDKTHDLGTGILNPSPAPKEEEALDPTKVFGKLSRGDYLGAREGQEPGEQKWIRADNHEAIKVEGQDIRDYGIQPLLDHKNQPVQSFQEGWFIGISSFIHHFSQATLFYQYHHLPPQTATDSGTYEIMRLFSEAGKPQPFHEFVHEYDTNGMMKSEIVFIADATTAKALQREGKLTEQKPCGDHILVRLQLNRDYR